MTFLRITIGQIGPGTGDVAGNIARMKQAAQTAQAAGADLIVFPELSLAGNLAGDLLNTPDFVDCVEQGLEELRQTTRAFPGLHWVVGVPTRRHGPGKPLENSLLVLRDGELCLQYAKQRLPVYNVFDERRYFEPGAEKPSTIEIKGIRIGFLIGEDAIPGAGESYAANPLAGLAETAPDLVISINADPSYAYRHEQRRAMYHAASSQHELPMLYVNQVGGYDQLVYDGASFAVMPDKGTVFTAELFEPSLPTVAFGKDAGFASADGTPLPAVSEPAMPLMEFYRRQIVLGLRDYAHCSGFRQAVVGSSGGIDSALVIALAAEALGPENIAAITMPSRFSSAGSVDDSVTLCRNLGVKLFEHPIRDIVRQYEDGFPEAFAAPLQGLAQENLQARIRGTLLMAYSNSYGHLLLTTGNKSELAVGYCTLYGDTNGGLGLIGDLYKTEVFALSRYLNEAAHRELIPMSIIEKEPSAELAPNQRDADSLPPYPVLDTFLKVLIEGNCLMNEEKRFVEQDFARMVAGEEGQALLKRIKRLIARSEYKRRQTPPTLRLRTRAFGRGRQMPLTTVYE